MHFSPWPVDMSSQDNSAPDLEKLLNIDIDQTIKEIIAAGKKRTAGDAEKKDSLINNLKQIRKSLEEHREENENLKKEIADLKITREDLIGIVKDTMKEEIRHLLMEELKAEFAEELAKAVSGILEEKQASTPILQRGSSYADTVAFPSLPKPKPTLVLSPVDESISTQTIKKQLNTIPSRDLGLLQCTATKTGRIILQCETKEKLENLKNVLTSNDELKNTVDISESKPRLLKIIVFGAPEPPAPPQKITDGLTDELQDYLQNLVTPGLQRLLNKEPDYNLTRIQRGKRGTVNLILDLPETDAATALQKGKTFVGFNHCSIRRFIMVRRCFKCQRFDHTSYNCPNNLTCPFCSGEHSSEDCTIKNNREKLVCINCVERLSQLPPNDRRRTLTKTNHCCFDSGCRTYKSKFEEIKAKINKAQNVQNSRSFN